MREEIDTYRSIQECVEKVKTYLVETERRERIAAAGRKRAVQDHTWDHRFADLLSVLRGTGTAGIRNNLVQSYES
jgi:spore maturation protein CgeB